MPCMAMPEAVGAFIRIPHSGKGKISLTTGKGRELRSRTKEQRIWKESQVTPAKPPGTCRVGVRWNGRCRRWGERDVTRLWIFLLGLIFWANFQHMARLGSPSLLLNESALSSNRVKHRAALSPH